MICPNCRQEAPTVVRGVRAYCTACGAPRSLIEDTPVNVAGQPSKIGGGMAAAAGLLVLFIGTLVALIIGAVLQMLVPPAGLVVGGFLGLVTLFITAMFLWGGRMLFQSGAERERGAQERAVWAIARRHGGSVTAAELARALTISEADADAFLTAMAKRPDGRVTLEVDDDGTLRYEVRELRRVRFGERKRVTTGARVASPNSVMDAEFEEVRAEEEAQEAEKRMRR
ncbi:MAG: hypothetical protein IPM54_44165 [Polyangiaceae bacterium]|nr:hypothetical protein [Polyangiaceae bacterium]